MLFWVLPGKSLGVFLSNLSSNALLLVNSGRDEWETLPDSAFSLPSRFGPAYKCSRSLGSSQDCTTQPEWLAARLKCQTYTPAIAQRGCNPIPASQGFSLLPWMGRQSLGASSPLEDTSASRRQWETLAPLIPHSAPPWSVAGCLQWALVFVKHGVRCWAAEPIEERKLIHP